MYEPEANLVELNTKWLCDLTVLFIQIFFFIGQSYEIRMLDNRKAGDIPEINGKLVKVRSSPDSVNNKPLLIAYVESSILTCYCTLTHGT